MECLRTPKIKCSPQTPRNREELARFKWRQTMKVARQFRWIRDCLWQMASADDADSSGQSSRQLASADGRIRRFRRFRQMAVEAGAFGLRLRSSTLCCRSGGRGDLKLRRTAAWAEAETRTMRARSSETKTLRGRKLQPRSCARNFADAEYGGRMKRAAQK
eukprot:6172137-Pleurochrysis_carterae.AAC.2